MSGHTDDGGRAARRPEGDAFEALVGWLTTGAWSDALEAARTNEPEAFEARVALARAVLARLSEARLPEPTPAQRAAALRLAGGAGASALLDGLRAGASKAWRTLRATWVDGAAGPTPAFRAGGPAPFFALYSAEGYDVDVSLSEQGTLLGQVLPLDDAPSFAGGTCHVVPLEPGYPPRHTTIGPDGDFAVPGPLAAAVELVLERDAGDEPVRLVIERVAWAPPGRGEASRQP